MERTLQETIGLRVTALRVQKGLTRYRFAKLLGWKEPYVSRFEEGHWRLIEPAKLQRLCQVLECSADFLIGLTKEQTLPQAA